MELFAPQHLLLISLIIVILFGGKKLPELSRSIAESMKELRAGMANDTPAKTPTSETQKVDS